MWGRLKRTLEEHTPPSLLCPTLYPPNRATWGFKHLRLRMGELPFIEAGTLAWINKEHLNQFREHSSGLPDRLHDILLRIGEAATAPEPEPGPEVAHLMLDPRSLTDALAGLRCRGSVSLITTCRCRREFSQCKSSIPSNLF